MGRVTDHYQLFQLAGGVKEQRGQQNNKLAGLICSCSEGGGGVGRVGGGYSLLSWTRATKPIRGSCGVTCMEGGGGAEEPPDTGGRGRRGQMCVSGRQRVCQREEEVLLAIHYSRRQEIGFLSDSSENTKHVFKQQD